MLRSGRIVLLVSAILVAALQLPLIPAGRSAMVSKALWGRPLAPSGWRFASGGETNPGPALFANQGDTVELILNQDDALPH